MSDNDIRTKFSRKDVYLLPPEELTIITDPAHPLYDERINLPLDKCMIANVKKFGVKENVIAKREGGKFLVAAGRQRVRWTLAANVELRAEGQAPLRVPVTIEKADDDELMGIMVLENECRVGDGPIEKARKAARLISRGYSEAEAAVTFGVSRAALRNWLKLLDAAPAVQEAVERRELKTSAALQLSDLPREKQAAAVAELREGAAAGKKATAAAAAEAAVRADGGEGKAKAAEASERRRALLSAAPDLLAACRMAEEHIDDSLHCRTPRHHVLKTLVPALRAAIAKAEGRGVKIKKADQG